VHPVEARRQEQSFEDFLTRGPAYDDWLSPAALAELTAAVRARVGGGST
jgi:hypothetical protein